MKKLMLFLSMAAVPPVGLLVTGANSFPPCNANFINEVWQAQDATFWYCDGKNWQAMVGALDGGYVTLTTTQAGIAGDKSFVQNVGIDGGLVVKGSSSTGGPFCIGTACADFNDPYFEFTAPILGKSGDPSLVSQGTSYFYAPIKFSVTGGSLQQTSPNSGITMTGNKYALDPGADFNFDSTAVRDAGNLICFANGGSNCNAGAVNYLGDIITGSIGAGHRGGKFSATVGSGDTVLDCNDTGVGCYSPIQGHLRNDSLHGEVVISDDQAARVSGGSDGGLVLQILTGFARGDAPSGSILYVSVYGDWNFWGGTIRPYFSTTAKLPPCASQTDQYGNVGPGALVYNDQTKTYQMCDGSTFANSNFAVSSAARPLQSGSTTLSTGTKTVTVASGASCVCSSATSNAVHCSVSSTTLTVTGTSSDAFSYVCL